jgi:pimeloyl-ACP methyl ester carboxylesterase
MPVAKVNGCGIYYETTGSGPDVVFVHGEDHGIEMFRDQVPYFAPNYRCTTYYRRGHGKSESAPYGYSVWNQSQDLAGLIDHLDIRRCTFVAVGMGNPVVVTFAITNPDRVNGIAMAAWYELDGYPLLEQRRTQSHKLSFAALHLQMHEIQTAEGNEGLRRFIEQNVDVYFPIFPLEAEGRKRMVEMVSSHPAGHFLQAVEHYASLPNLVPELGRIEAPLLGICGSDDPSPDRPELLAHLPNFRQAWIEGARRFTLMERPDDFNQLVRGFLDQTSAWSESQS